MCVSLQKARLITVILAFLLFVPASMFPTAKASLGENGEWIAHPFTYPTTGSVFAVCGEDCIAVAREVSNVILFFDINKSAWTELKLNVSQTIRDVKAKGHTVFVYTYYFIIGYSSFTCSYDVIAYQGALVNTVYGPAYYGGKNLALFVTNETMYVFDSKLGHWREYAALPAGYSGSAYVMRDDYVFFRWTFADKPPKIVVYSLHTHSFNQLEDGGSYPGSYNRWSFEMLDHGFAGYYERETENFVLVGYSAYTNEFDLLPVSGLGAQFAPSYGGNPEQGEHTAYAISFRQELLPDEIRGHFYGYDTRLGSWSYTTVSFIVGQDRWGQSWFPGGQFLVDTAVLPGELYKFIIYSGITGQFSIETPGLTYNSVTSWIVCGGEVLLVCDDDSAWTYSLVTEKKSIVSSDKPRTAYSVAGNDFCVFGRDSTESSTTTMHIYNSETDNWTIMDLTKVIHSILLEYNEHVFLYSAYDSPVRETVFYSSFIDAYEKCEFPVNSTLSLTDVTYNLAWASASNKSYLFNARTGALYKFNFKFTQNGLGNSAASFYNTETKTLYGYSVLSGKWTNLTIIDTPYGCNTVDYIGLISSNTATTYYKKYYAYNGFTDSWVELVPEGTAMGHRIGEKTALVIRSSMLYAFDPNGRIGIYNYLIEYEGNFYPVTLFTNSTISGFSFNGSLKEINFNATGQDGTIGFCNLTLPNALVQNLWQGSFTILVDGEQPTYLSTWTDGTYTYIYFTYAHSRHKIVIVPEFSSLAILPLLVGVALLTTMFRRRRQHSRPNTRKG
ncbi:MAG: hypothetical protein QXM22_04190 [Candidatus Bathyarchaeia archaeon]